jgi:hypothetical protein
MEALKKEKDKVLVQLRAVQDNIVSQESEKEEIWVKIQEEKSQLHR